MEGKILYICSDFYPMSTGYSNAFSNFLDAIGNYQVDILTTTKDASLKKVLLIEQFLNLKLFMGVVRWIILLTL